MTMQRLDAVQPRLAWRTKPASPCSSAPAISSKCRCLTPRSSRAIPRGRRRRNHASGRRERARDGSDRRAGRCRAAGTIARAGYSSRSTRDRLRRGIRDPGRQRDGRGQAAGNLPVARKARCAGLHQRGRGAHAFRLEDGDSGAQEFRRPIREREPRRPARQLSADDVEVQPGDRIVVTRGGVVYVLGDVGKPGGYLIENQDKISVLQALALAQGMNKTAKSTASLIR